MRFSSALFLLALASCGTPPGDCAPLSFRDADGDGFGDIHHTSESCTLAPGFVADAGDCDDGDAWVFPGAPEVATDRIDRNCDGRSGMTDADGDGAPAALDCDDADPLVNRDAPETCDGVDNDCDGRVDVDALDQAIWFPDVDQDGHGRDAVGVRSCEAPDGYVAAAGDCDDRDAARHPGAAEADCRDPIDYNCDGAVGYADGDLDGFAACEDCDDQVAAVNADAIEACNEVDDDCDGVADEAGAVGERAFYPDLDRDGFGDDIAAILACHAPNDGFTDLAGDCDDADAAYHPGAAEVCDDAHDFNCDGAVAYADGDEDGFPACLDCDDAQATVNADGLEVCNGLDDDCDGEIDEAALDPGTWYRDADHDGFGDTEEAVVACVPPIGFVAALGDCDDEDPRYRPGAPEACDQSIDYNCDGGTAYTDLDGDGVPACLDCDDARAEVNDDGVERCNGIDDNCDGRVDESSAVDAETWYVDVDGDGAGDPATALSSCSQPAGYRPDGGDCDDADSSARPGRVERCDSIDNDCDAQIDEGAVDATNFYADGDGDGFGAGRPLRVCAAPLGWVADHADCDDGDAGRGPGAPERCDGLDNDCDGLVDEGAGDAAVWYADGDGDGFGDAESTITACAAPPGYVADASDCDDARGSASPVGEERCDGLDNDCDGAVDEDGAIDARRWHLDADADGYGDAERAIVACAAPEGFVADDADCDDSASSVHPGAEEICNGEDEDCDAVIDPSTATGAVPWFFDADADGYGGASSVTSCEAPVGYVAMGDDCDDASSSSFPGAVETCNGVDDDCDAAPDDGLVAQWYPDHDADGFGGADGAVASCAPMAGFVASADDCDDVDGSVFPGALEVCDGLQNDCDAVAWTPADEDGVVSMQSLTGGWTNVAVSTNPGAVNALALPSGVLWACAGTYYVNATTEIEGSSRIIGRYGLENTVFDGAGAGQVLSVVAGSTLVIEGLTVRDGRSEGAGGGVYNAGDLTMIDSEIADNVATDGGGLYAAAGSLTSLRGTRVDGNAANGDGGGLYFAPGAVGALVDASSVWNNVAGRYGGGLYVSGAEVSFAGSSGLSDIGFLGNAAVNGGGVYVSAAPGGVFDAFECDFGDDEIGDNLGGEGTEDLVLAGWSLNWGDDLTLRFLVDEPT